MKNDIFFSIALPTYNRSEKLKKAIEYLLAQNFKRFEIVVCDNCSTDDTEDIVKSFKSKKIKYYRNKKNIDVLPNVKKSIRLSKGEYVFLHADDDFLIEKDTLSKVYKLIKKNKLGYIRLNYLSISPDNKHIFDFRASKGFTKNAVLLPKAKPLKVINFLISSDCSFITGIIFKNKLPSNLTINVNTQIYPWFPIIYFIAERFGGYYINDPYILAEWSQWRVTKNNFNPLFSLVNGKLTSEPYFKFIEKKLEKNQYREFLEKHLSGIYVKNSLAIRLFTGNKNLIKLFARLRSLSPNLKKSLFYWLNLCLAFITPRTIITILRKFYLTIYINRNNRDSKYNIEKFN